MTHQEQVQRRMKLAEDFRSGMTVTEVAAKHRVLPGLVYSALKEHGLKTDRANHLSSSTFHIIADLIATTESLTSLATRHRVSRQRISQIYLAAKDAGIPVRPREPGGFMAKKSRDLEGASLPPRESVPRH